MLHQQWSCAMSKMFVCMFDNSYVSVYVCVCLQATVEDVCSVPAAVSWFSRVLQQQQAAGKPLNQQQAAALQTLLTDIWKEGQAFPQTQAAAAGSTTGQSPDAAETSTTAAASTSNKQQQQEEEEEWQEVEGDADQQVADLAVSVGLPAGTCSLSLLHSCWHQLLTQMMLAGQSQGVLAVLDGVAAAATNAAVAASTAANSQDSQQQQRVQLVLPVDESEASQLLQEAGCVMGVAGQVVMRLLLPYATLQEQAMQQIEQGQVLVAAGDPWIKQLLVLLLLRGQLVRLNGVAAVSRRRPSSSDGSGAGTAAGGSSAAWGQQQLYEVWRLLLGDAAAAGGRHQAGGAADDFSLKTLLPHVVAQLCLGDDYASAAALVASKMRLSAGLSTLQGALLVLERYLAMVMHTQQQQPVPPVQGSGSAVAGAAAGGGSKLPCCEGWLVSNTAAAAHTAHDKLVRALAYGAGG